MQQLEHMYQGRTGVPDVDEEVEMTRARMWLALGDVDHAGQWADHMARLDPADYVQGWGHVTLARVRLAQGRYAEAVAALEAVARLPDAGKRPYRQLRVDLYSALAGLGYQERACYALEACLSAAEPGGYCRLFLDAGEPVRELLAAYLKAPAARHAGYAQTLLDAFPNSIAGHPSSDWVDALTARELDVLRLMAEGLSNRQIASQLILSEGTVKFYVHAFWRSFRYTIARRQASGQGN